MEAGRLRGPSAARAQPSLRSCICNIIIKTHQTINSPCLNEVECLLSKCGMATVSPTKSSPLDFGTKNSFPSFFVREKGLVRIN